MTSGRFMFSGRMGASGLVGSILLMEGVGCSVGGLKFRRAGGEGGS